MRAGEPRKGLEIQLLIELRPEPSRAWARLFQWLLSEGGNDPDADDRVKRGDGRAGDNDDE